MSDQCAHCTARGDAATCEQTECGWHELWYVQHLRTQLEKAEREAERVQDRR